MGFPRQEYWSGLPFPPPGPLWGLQHNYSFTHSSHRHTLPLSEVPSWAPCSNLRGKRKVRHTPEGLCAQTQLCGRRREAMSSGRNPGLLGRSGGTLSPAYRQRGRWLLLRPNPWTVRMHWLHLQAWLTFQPLRSGQVDDEGIAGREGRQGGEQAERKIQVSGAAAAHRGGGSAST